MADHVGCFKLPDNDSSGLSPESIQSFQNHIYETYRANPRPMPWRETREPYKILISEIMLQQTQVARVLLKYDQFLAAFPTLSALAAAELADVLKVWQGLGYNRRALSLKRCAEEIVERHGGLFPVTVSELERLPGIGPYTARAVGAFAFGIASPLIETNIRTVFIHYFFHGRDLVTDQEIMPLVAATLDRGNPREWYYALMDYGVMLKQLHSNPGRRSAHHAKQSRFEGSNRQLRSRMLREILANPGVTASTMTKTLSADRDAIEINLDAMEREGLLEKRGNQYHIAADTKKVMQAPRK